MGDRPPINTPQPRFIEKILNLQQYYCNLRSITITGIPHSHDHLCTPQGFNGSRDVIFKITSIDVKAD